MKTIHIKIRNIFYKGTYWRIPATLTAEELRKRADILAGGDASTDNMVNEADDFGPLAVSDSEDEDDNAQHSRMNQANSLMYNDSDGEDEVRQPLKLKEPKAATKKINIFDMIKNNEDSNDSNEPANQSNIHDTHEASDDDGNSTSHTIRSKKRGILIDSDSDTEPEPEPQPEEVEINTEEFSSQMIRSRLAALEDSESGESDHDDDEISHSTTKKARNRIESDESDNENDIKSPSSPVTDTSNTAVQLNKRQRARNDDNDDNDAELDTIPSAPQLKKPKLSIVDDDDASD